MEVSFFQKKQKKTSEFIQTTYILQFCSCTKCSIIFHNLHAKLVHFLLCIEQVLQTYRTYLMFSNQKCLQNIQKHGTNIVRATFPPFFIRTCKSNSFIFLNLNRIIESPSFQHQNIWIHNIADNFCELHSISDIYTLSRWWFKYNKYVVRKCGEYIYVYFYLGMCYENYCIRFCDASWFLFTKRMEFIRFFHRSHWVGHTKFWFFFSLFSFH